MIPTTATGVAASLSCFAFFAKICDVCRLLESTDVKEVLHRKKDTILDCNIFL